MGVISTTSTYSRNGEFELTSCPTGRSPPRSHPHNDGKNECGQKSIERRVVVQEVGQEPEPNQSLVEAVENLHRHHSRNRAGGMHAGAIAELASHQAEDTDHGEVGEHIHRQIKPDVDDHHQKRRDNHVERERRKTRIPVLCPARETQVGYEHVAQICRGPHVRAQIATGGCGVGKPDPRSQVASNEQHRHSNNRKGEAAP